jgi:hypothetical protein
MSKTQDSCGLQADSTTGFREAVGDVTQQNCRPMTHITKHKRQPMKIAFPILLLAALASTPAYSQTVQTDCERDVDVRLNEMWNIAAAAGSVTSKKIMDRAMSCMQGGQCSKPEALVRLQEIMVDEQVIDLQRKKVALMKRFADLAGPTSNACTVASLLKPLVDELTSLNSQQLARFETLAKQYYPSGGRR